MPCLVLANGFTTYLPWSLTLLPLLLRSLNLISFGDLSTLLGRCPSDTVSFFLPSLFTTLPSQLFRMALRALPSLTLIYYSTQHAFHNLCLKKKANICIFLVLGKF